MCVTQRLVELYIAIIPGPLVKLLVRKDFFRVETRADIVLFKEFGHIIGVDIDRCAGQGISEVVDELIFRVHGIGNGVFAGSQWVGQYLG